MISGAAAPTARADDFSDVISALDFDFSEGQTAFTDAATDFSSSDLAPGLALLFDGVDNDAVVVPENFVRGTGEVSANESVNVTTPFFWSLPSDFSDAVGNAEAFFPDASNLFTEGATALAGGDIGDALVDYTYGLNAIVVDPLQELLLGAAVSF